VHSVSCRGSVFVSCVLVGLSNPLEPIEGRIEVMYAGIARGSQLKEKTIVGQDPTGEVEVNVVKLSCIPRQHWFLYSQTLMVKAPLNRRPPVIELARSAFFTRQTHHGCFDQHYDT
jgi:hypothetical protein